MELGMRNVFKPEKWSFRGQVHAVDEWFLMSSPLPLFTILGVYLLIVLKLGPSFMKNRPAFQLRKTLLVYNLFQVGFSCFLFQLGVSLLSEYGLVTSKCVIEQENAREKVVKAIYLYFLAKVSELLDTVFFVVRKKQSQITFLHVYHHCLMMVATWFSLKYNPTDALVFLGTINSLVHVVMYGYYGLSAFPNLAKYLWWKKYLTTFQLVQFLMITLQVAATSMVSACRPSYVLIFTVIFNTFFFMYLFGNFYVKNYTEKPEKKEDFNFTKKH